MEPANASGPSVSLSSLFREYLHQDDSLEDVELKPASSVRAVAPVQAVPVVAGADPVKPLAAVMPVAAGPVTTSVEVDKSRPTGLLPFWFRNSRIAAKSTGPTVIHLSWVEFFYDLVYATTLIAFSVNIAFGWPTGKWLNFVQMLMVLSLWHDNAVYTSTFHSQDGVSRFVIFLSLLGVIGMAFHRNVVSSGSEFTFRGYAIAFLWARFFQALLWLQVAFTSPATGVTRQNKTAALVWGIVSLLTCIPVAVTIGLQSSVSLYGRVMIWLVQCGLDLALALLLPLVLLWWRTALPIANTRVLRDRCGAFVLFLFGYLLQAIYFDETGPHTAYVWGQVALLLLIGFCFMWLYYDGDRHDDDKFGCVSPVQRSGTHVAGHLWHCSHVPLAMALVIMADASVQFIYWARGIARNPNTVTQVATGPGQSTFVLSNTVFWIYGVSFAVALALITIQGLLYEYHTARQLKRKFGRAIGRFALVIIMVLIPLGGINNAADLNPIIPIIVGAVLMLVLVVVDWAFNAALAPSLPDTETRTVTYAGGADGARLAAQLAERDAELAALRAQLAEAKQQQRGGVAVVPAVVAAGDVDRVESEDLSSSKNWGFSSRTSSVVEDVVVSSDGDESREFVDHEPSGESTERINVANVARNSDRSNEQNNNYRSDRDHASTETSSNAERSTGEDSVDK